MFSCLVQLFERVIVEAVADKGRVTFLTVNLVHRDWS